MAAPAHPRTPQDADRHVGATVAALRKARGISQTSLALACGVSFQQIQKYEAGVNRIGAGRLHQIADRLGVPVADLLAPADQPNSAGITLNQLQQPDVAELLQAFGRISSPDVRHHVVSFVQAAARALVTAGGAA